MKIIATATKGNDTRDRVHRLELTAEHEMEEKFLLTMFNQMRRLEQFYPGSRIITNPTMTADDTDPFESVGRSDRRG